MPQCRVLLADDDPQIRAFLQAALRARQYLVDLASDGVEALDVVERLGATVNLLITDIKMPRMDGVSLARAVAQILPRLPVLFISGWADPLEEPEWQKPQYAFLRKPFLPKALVSCIEELLARSSAASAAAHS
ncbi:MAG TPA: response regulator [Candidatus Limnocylindrales bacterium]|jgi:CheY-like chemotaxis protein|nr:response regulator [Candidatus Limnocylindrales bacterium]